MNKKGFVFIETVITIVVLTTALILLYSTYSSTISVEKDRLYYDDIIYVYRTKAIRDVINYTYDNNKFSLAASEKTDIYFYVFNETNTSNIWRDTSLIQKAKDKYHFIKLIYINSENDLKALKDCIYDYKKNDSDFNKMTDDENWTICTENISEIGDDGLINYLCALDVPEGTIDKGILISVIQEKKDGTANDDINSKYENCIQNKVINYFIDDPSSATEEIKNEAMESYRESNIRFNMSCETAYYYSWVYM